MLGAVGGLSRAALPRLPVRQHEALQIAQVGQQRTQVRRGGAELFGEPGIDRPCGGGGVGNRLGRGRQRVERAIQAAGLDLGQVGTACPSASLRLPLAARRSRRLKRPSRGDCTKAVVRNAPSRPIGSLRPTSALTRAVGSLSSSASSCGCTLSQCWPSRPWISARASVQPGRPRSRSQAAPSLLAMRRSRLRLACDEAFRVMPIAPVGAPTMIRTHQAAHAAERGCCRVTSGE